LVNRLTDNFSNLKKTKYNKSVKMYIDTKINLSVKGKNEKKTNNDV
jgi:hypothetical protein